MIRAAALTALCALCGSLALAGCGSSERRATIRVKAKTQKTNLAEFRDFILKPLKDPQGLLDELLGEYTEAYKALLGRGARGV